MPGFHFTEIPPQMVLVCAMDRENRIDQPFINRCRHPECWVLDYSITDCAPTRSEFTAWLPRPGGIGHLYPPGRRYEEDLRSKQKYHSAYLLFSGENPILRKITENSGGFARILDPERKLQKPLREAAAAAARGSRGYRESYGCFCGVLDLLEHLPQPSSPDYLYDLGDPVRSCGTLSRRVKEYLEQNFRKPLTVRKIARELGISESGLSHRYREEAGETLFDTILRIRAEQSLPLLLSGKRLKDIAPETGFSNEFYYSKIFKRIYGCSPGKMFGKQRNAENAPPPEKNK